MKPMAKLLCLVLCLAMIGGCFVACDFESIDSNGDQSSQTQNGESQSETTENGEWTITFDANGGAFENGETTQTQTVAQGARLTVPQTPRREGYTFSGWSVKQNTSEPWNFSTAVNNSLTLYASWTPKTASVLSLEGATINERDIFLIVDQNTQSVSLSDKVVCTEGCVWKLYRDQMGQIEIPTKIAAGMNGELNNGENIFYIVVTSLDGTMTSVYKLTVFRHYTVSINYYHANELIHSEQTTTGNEFFLTYSPNLEGYTFYGWKDKNGAPCISVIPWGDVNLYANTTAQQFTVTYDANEGSVNLTGTAVLFGESFTFEVPTRTGYRFMGWCYGETKLTDENGTSLSDWQILDNVTITAAWEINSYSLSLQRNDKGAGIICDMEKQTYDYGESITVRATKNLGYRFLGWFKGSMPMSTELSYTFTMPAEQLLLTAKWEILPEMRAFEFVSTPTLCQITYLKDRDLEEFVIPDYVTSIEDQAFQNCSNVTSITLGNGLTSIGQSSFANCSGLTSIAIPNNVKNIGFNAFYGCSNLADISIPDSVLGIDTFAFDDTAYKNDASKWTGGILYIGNHLISVKYATLSGATTINIKSGTKTIASNAFSNYRKLTSITIPDGVTSIGSGAFSGCTSLTTITIPDSVTSIGGGILSNTGYRFDTVTYIGNHLIQARESLSGAYTIKSGTKTIADNAFSYCERLTSVTIPNSVTNIGKSAFLNCNSLTTITIPESVTSIGNQAFSHCDSLTTITVHLNNPAYKSIDGNLYSKDGTELLQYAIGKAETNFTIPNGVTSIGNGAFMESNNLTSITLGNGVTIIGYSAFVRCSNLTNVTISDSIVIIGESAFAACNNLTSIAIPNSVKIIDSWAFENCSSLTSIIISNTVTTISYHAFLSCENLTDIYFEGTEEEWNAIEKSQAQIPSSATIHYNYVPSES